MLKEGRKTITRGRWDREGAKAMYLSLPAPREQHVESLAKAFYISKVTLYKAMKEEGWEEEAKAQDRAAQEQMRPILEQAKEQAMEIAKSIETLAIAKIREAVQNAKADISNVRNLKEAWTVARISQNKPASYIHQEQETSMSIITPEEIEEKNQEMLEKD